MASNQTKPRFISRRVHRRRENENTKTKTKQYVALFHEFLVLKGKTRQMNEWPLKRWTSLVPSNGSQKRRQLGIRALFLKGILRKLLAPFEDKKNLWTLPYERRKTPKKKQKTRCCSVPWISCFDRRDETNGWMTPQALYKFLSEFLITVHKKGHNEEY